MCSLVMSLCSSDLHVTSLNNNYNTLNSSRLTVVQLTQHLVFAYEEFAGINLLYIANVHGKNSSWNNHVNIFAIDWITQVINNCVYFCFLAQLPTSNFLDIDQEV